jgi:hypothetical protein
MAIQNPSHEAENLEPFRTQPLLRQIGSTATVKCGLLKLVVDFIEKKGTVMLETLVGEFGGRSVEGKKVTNERVARYVNYMRVNPRRRPASKAELAKGGVIALGLYGPSASLSSQILKQLAHLWTEIRRKHTLRVRSSNMQRLALSRSPVPQICGDPSFALLRLDSG